MDVALQIVLGAIIGYAFGMLPTGVIVGRSLGVDLTQVGSGRTGATNALRALGLRWAALVALVDILKGALPVLLIGWLLGGAPWWGQATWTQVSAASFAIIGHTFSPLIGFRGGRGILTGAGGMLVLSPPAFVCSLICGAAAIWLTRYVSVGSIVGAIVTMLVGFVQVGIGAAPPSFLVYGTLMPAFVIIAHRDNIQRLLNGTERRLSRGSDKNAT